MRLLWVVLLLANVFLYSLGVGWLGIVPSEINMGAGTKVPVEFKPQLIDFLQAK